MKKNFISIGLMLFFLAAVFVILFRQEKIDILYNIKLQNIILVVALFFISSFFTSCIYFLSYKEKNCILEKEDIFFFPLMQSLFSLIFPFQGSVLFSVGYLKIRYRLNFSESIPVIVFLYLINFVFAGIAGIVYFFSVKDSKLPVLFFALMSLFMPLWLWFVGKALDKFPNITLFPKKIKHAIVIFFHNLNELFRARHLLLYLLLFQCCRHLCLGTALYILAKSCGIDANWLWGYISILSQELAQVVKITPGGLGILEIVTGVVSNFTGVTIADGIAVAFVQRIIFDLSTILGGSVGFVFFFHRFHFSVSTFWQKLKETRASKTE